MRGFVLKYLIVLVGLLSGTILGEQAMAANRGSASDAIFVSVLYDNNAYDKRLKQAWGFSCLVELPHKTILFDTGGDSTVLLYNMEKLGFNPKDIEVVFLSHIHGDHVGGLAGFLRKNSTVTVYLPVSFPQRLKEEIRSLGATIEEADGARRLFGDVYTTGAIGTGMREQSLLLKTNKGLVVITGCAHPGVVTVAKKAMEITGDRIYLLLGGYHLFGASSFEIRSIIDAFLALRVEKVAPCHCTGDEAVNMLKQHYGVNYLECGAGRKIEIR